MILIVFFYLLELKQNEIDSLRLITKDLIEVNDEITLMLICPSIEQICIMNTTSATSSSTSFQSVENADCSQVDLTNKFTNNSYIFLPVQIFEAIHLNSYANEFIRPYVRLSILIEIETIASSQYQREAFSNDEILKAKKFTNTAIKYQKLLEEFWKESRWIIESINLARDKQNSHSNQIGSLSVFKSALESYSLLLRKSSIIKSIPNIYNQITKLPPMISFHHIDSVLIDDEHHSLEDDSPRTKVTTSGLGRLER